MSKLEETLNNMSFEELEIRIRKMEQQERHYRELKQETQIILRKKSWEIYNKQLREAREKFAK